MRGTPKFRRCSRMALEERGGSRPRHSMAADIDRNLQRFKEARIRLDSDVEGKRRRSAFCPVHAVMWRSKCFATSELSSIDENFRGPRPPSLSPFFSWNLSVFWPPPLRLRRVPRSLRQLRLRRRHRHFSFQAGPSSLRTKCQSIVTRRADSIALPLASFLPADELEDFFEAFATSASSQPPFSAKRQVTS